MIDNENITFRDDILRSKNYLIINRIGEANGLFMKMISYIYIFFIGIVGSLIIPIACSIVAATINYTGQEWLYGVALTCTCGAVIFRKFVRLSKPFILRSIAGSISSIQVYKSNNDNLNSNKSRNSKLIIKETNKLKLYCAILCEGDIRRERKLFWIEPTIGFLATLYFFTNQEITILSKEYLGFVFTLALTIIDLFAGGLFGSFNEFTSWVPKIKLGSNDLNFLIIGLLRFCIIILMTKCIIDKLKIKFSEQIWFEGNDIGLSYFLEKYINVFSEKEGSVIIYDFGLSEDFGKQSANILFNKMAKRRSDRLIRNLIKTNPIFIEKEKIPTYNLKFYESQLKNTYLTNNRHFNEGDIALDTSISDKCVVVYHYNTLSFEDFSHISYGISNQKLFFVDKGSNIIDSSIMVLFPLTMFFETSDVIQFVRIGQDGMSPPISFALEKEGDIDKKNIILMRFLWSAFKAFGKSKA